MTIWHVDDDELQLELVSGILKKAKPDLEMISMSHGRHLLERLKQEAPDVLLLDLNMPVLSGWDVLEIMTKESHSIPTWILSSSINPRDKTRSQSYKLVRGFLVKPLTFSMAISLFDNFQEI